MTYLNFHIFEFLAVLIWCVLFLFLFFSLQSVVEEDEASQELKEKKMRERLVFDFDFFLIWLEKPLWEKFFYRSIGLSARFLLFLLNWSLFNNKYIWFNDIALSTNGTSIFWWFAFAHTGLKGLNANLLTVRLHDWTPLSMFS